jgi:hypothetical protein
MDAREVARRSAAGAPALQALRPCVREQAGTRAAHAAAQGLCKRRRPMGWAALQWSCAQRGTGEVGPAVMRADGVGLPRERPRRGRADGSRVGTWAVARTCDRRPGAPGIGPLDAPVNRPARGDASGLQAWRTRCAVAPPVHERAGGFAPRLDLARAERGVLAVAPEAPADAEGCSAPRPVPPADPAGARLVVSLDGTGVPLIKAAAVTRNATWGTGATRPTQPAALVGVGETVEANPRARAARAARLVAPDAARARRQRAAVGDEAPRAPHVRRLARLVRTPQAVLDGITADAQRRAPQHRHPGVVRRAGALGRWRLAPTRVREGRRGTCGRDLRPGVGSRWSAANAWCGAGAQAGTRGVQPQLTAILRGRVGDVMGGWRPLLTTRPLRSSVRETRATVLPCCPHHRRWRPDAVDVAAGWPVGTGGVAAACGAVVKHRMAGAGPRGSLNGAAAIRAWRALTKSHDHARRDDWRFRAHHLRARRDGRQPT